MDKELENMLSEISKETVDHCLKIGENRYAAIFTCKSIDGRVWSYAIVDIKEYKSEASFSQFEDYIDLLINLSIHAKIEKCELRQIIDGASD